MKRYRKPKPGSFEQFARETEQSGTAITALTPKTPQVYECTPLTAARISAMVQTGDYTLVSAAATLGISAKVLRKWRRIAEDPTTPIDSHHRSFFATIDAAASKAQKPLMKKLKKMAMDEVHPGQLKALQTLLKALDPDTFGDKIKQEITGEDGDPIKIDSRIALLTDAELDARMRQLEQAQRMNETTSELHATQFPRENHEEED